MASLYMVPPSGPCRAVLMTAKVLGVDLELKSLDLLNYEQLKPDFIKINPQHTVPTLVEEDGFVLWDSHAIMAYLVSKYGKNDDLYPADLRRRALVDQRLHFDNGVAFATLARVVLPILWDGKTKVTEPEVETFHAVYGFVEAFLDGKEWIAGDSVTIADYSLYTTLSSSTVFAPISEEEYPKTVSWLQKVGNLPEAEVSKEGHAQFVNAMETKLKH